LHEVQKINALRKNRIFPYVHLHISLLNLLSELQLSLILSNYTKYFWENFILFRVFALQFLIYLHET